MTEEKKVDLVQQDDVQTLEDLKASVGDKTFGEVTEDLEETKKEED